MLFEIVHRTDYRYGHAAREACVEARLTPPNLPTQKILSHVLEFNPPTACSHYEDSFGNDVTFYAMALRHERLSVVNTLVVQTKEPEPDQDALGVSCAEARQILSSELTNVFDYLQPTPAVPTGGEAKAWAREFFSGSRSLREGLDGLNSAIHTKFAYKPGTTENSTPLAVVWKQKEGVCQDFAHIMLSVLRTAGIPARYICGYIESGPPEGGGLLGSLATHAWVEALLPGMTWVALDPTNNQWCGPRHVAVSYGRDFRDAAPVRGIFKGSGPQGLKVKVTMRRMTQKR
ncbi:MAG: transglutaminase family protein [Terrimicrobiaceae bacterium]